MNYYRCCGCNNLTPEGEWNYKQDSYGVPGSEFQAPICPECGSDELVEWDNADASRVIHDIRKELDRLRYAAIDERSLRPDYLANRTTEGLKQIAKGIRDLECFIRGCENVEEYLDEL